ncbi:MAG: hypothetical protein KDJ87_18620 [Rhizobiaceae bacterium]|nr:hypothetical protein [Rhizobiaceae bacterium]
MGKLAFILFITSLAIGAATSHAEAGWKKRGWYQKRPGANCVMRRVVVTGADGRVVVRTVRVCR